MILFKFFWFVILIGFVLSGEWFGFCVICSLLRIRGRLKLEGLLLKIKFSDFSYCKDCLVFCI